MTTIRPFTAGTVTASRTATQLAGLKRQLDTLSTQLSTGRVAETYGGLGSARAAALSAQGTLSALDGYGAAITAGQLRAKLAVASLTQVTARAASTREALQAGLSQSGGTAGTLALGDLDAALDALDQSAGGVYLFGGRDAATEPVLGTDAILNGATDATGARLAGLRTLVSEQVRADLGAGGDGRVAVGRPDATSVSLAEDPSAEARANFGFTIAGVGTTGSALTAAVTGAAPATVRAQFQAAPTEGQRFRVVVNQPDGSQRTVDFTATAGPAASVENPFPVTASPADAEAALDALVAPGTLAGVQSAAPTDVPPGPGLSLSFSGGSPGSATVGLGSPAAQPAIGDALTVTLKLHDGTTTTLTLTAAAGAAAGSATTFAIGADAAGTAANIAAALGNALKAAAGGALTASSTARAAQDFFAGSTAPGLAPRRVAFDGAGNATGYAQTPRTDTVIWYRGEDSGAEPRATQSLQIGAGATARIGARANEASLRATLAGLATAAIGLPAAGASAATYQAFADRAGALLSAGTAAQGIVTDISLASARMADAADTNAATKATLQDAVDGIEQAPMQEVAAKLLEAQNRLQASYQVTASLAKLSLVNYLG